MNSDLAKRHTVRELVAAFEAAEAVTRRCFAELAEASRALNAVFTDGNVCGIRIDASHSGSWDNFDNADRAVERMSRDAWGIIVEKLELRRMMSTSRWSELSKQLKEGDLPKITEANVFGFAKSYADALPEMIEEAVREVYDWLRPRDREHSRAGEYKTNQIYVVGERVVLPYMVESEWVKDGFRVRFDRSQQQLIALENVFRALDGAGNVGKEHFSVLERAIKESGPKGVGETEYFGFRAFKNGNLHLRFKRRDLLGRFNQIAGGKRLRPNQEAA
jgi:hypothetical protein